MKSPITGKEMKLKTEKTILKFRKEDFEVVYHFYLCEDTKEQFTNDRLDNLNMIQVYNQYREKHGIPFPEQIIAIREKYGVSANKMSEILGLGQNSYRLYENGEIPSVSIGRLILSVDDPEEFLHQVKLSQSMLKEKELNDLKAKAEKLIQTEKQTFEETLFKKRVFYSNKPELCTGYIKPNYQKTFEVVAFFSERMELQKTKLNKLLFYADFTMYGNYGYSITGNAYRAVDYGPVPSNYGMLYEELINDGLIENSFEFYENGGHYERLKPLKAIKIKRLSKEELEILELIANKFKDFTPKQIVDLSHKEKAWKENIESKSIVSYQDYAFSLSGI